MYSMPDRIRQSRWGAGLSQAQLAAEAGVRRSAVAQWERVAGNFPSVSHLTRVAYVTGVNFEWLATGRGPMRPPNGEYVMAADTADFAMDELETQVLESMRKLTPRNRALACKIIQVMAG